MLTSIFTGPFKGLLFVAQKIHEATQQERAADRDLTMDALRKLHLRYEAGELDDEGFAEQEELLLNRLEDLE